MSQLATIDPQRLSLLSPEEAVDVFRDLLWAEAWRQGVNILDVNVPSNITAADGGVDADVNAAPVQAGVIAQGLSRFQIKTGDFPARTEGDLRELFFKKGTTDFKDRVKHCFDNNGRFIAVLFGSDNPDTQEDAAITKITEFLHKYHPEVTGPRVDVMRANQIAGALRAHVSLTGTKYRSGQPKAGSIPSAAAAIREYEAVWIHIRTSGARACLI